MPLQPGEYKATIQVPLQPGEPAPTTTQVQQAIIAGFVANNLPVPTSVTVE